MPVYAIEITYPDGSIKYVCDTYEAHPDLSRCRTSVGDRSANALVRKWQRMCRPDVYMSYAGCTVRAVPITIQLKETA